MTATLPGRPSDDRRPDSSPFAPVSRLQAFSTVLAERPLGPTPDFRVALRARLLEEAGHPGAADTDTPRAAPVATRRRSVRGRRVTAVGLAVVLTGGGVAAAAAGRSLPGEPLYPAKRIGQSVEQALDPASGDGPSLRLVSARISDVERTAAIDPTGRDVWRWRGVDQAVGDADSALASVVTVPAGSSTATALTRTRTRLARLVGAVPTAYRPAVQGLLDRVDALLPAPSVAGGADLLSPLLSSAPDVSPAGALAAGWPLELPALERGPASGATRPGAGSSALPRPGAGSAARAGSAKHTPSEVIRPAGAGTAGSASATSSHSSGPAGPSTTSSGVGRVLGTASGGTSSGSTTRTSSGPGADRPAHAVAASTGTALGDTLDGADHLLPGLPLDGLATTR